jgi:hypothetical protein
VIEILMLLRVVCVCACVCVCVFGRRDLDPVGKELFFGFFFFRVVSLVLVA